MPLNKPPQIDLEHYRQRRPDGSSLARMTPRAYRRYGVFWFLFAVVALAAVFWFRNQVSPESLFFVTVIFAAAAGGAAIIAWGHI